MWLTNTIVCTPLKILVLFAFDMLEFLSQSSNQDITSVIVVDVGNSLFICCFAWSRMVLAGTDLRD